MCGLIGLIRSQQSRLPLSLVRPTVERLLIASESRGVEASGVAFKGGGCVLTRKAAVRSSIFVKSAEFAELLTHRIPSAPAYPICILGHSRLVTDGTAMDNHNNQPVSVGTVTAIHNGIIVNASQLWQDNPHLTRTSELDTEVAVALFNALRSSLALVPAMQQLYERIEGEASMGFLFEDDERVVLTTNSGSLFYAYSEGSGVILIASELRILKTVSSDPSLRAILPTPSFKQIRAASGVVIYPNTLGTEEFTLSPSRPRAACSISKQPHTNTKVPQRNRRAMPSLRRCTRCILPDTFPFLTFDEQGVCSLCRSHTPYRLRGEAALGPILAGAHKKKPDNACLVALSGGRDSCYGLHCLKTKLGVHPVAFTYDWGMVTDLARRNMARMCGSLGVEHVIISADIRKKRDNIRRSITAWLKRPSLGMVPLFMAGDKQFYYYANQLVKEMEIPLMIFCENQRFEKTRFKSAFCGVDEGNRRLFNLGVGNKFDLVRYFSAQVLANTAYLNPALWDALLGFASAYGLRHDYLFLFDFIPWHERTVEQTLISQYGWEQSVDSPTTWRIGDGTAPFYNYIYYTVAGFSEFDTFRSNQIREGVLTRDEALRLVELENQPRWESLNWYFETVGLDMKSTLAEIDQIPKLYRC